MVRATGKCAECHTEQHYSIVHEYEMSAHAAKGVSCLECHQPQGNQERKDHHGFVLTKTVTANNCRSCHETEYQQFLRSRHAAPSWAAVYGEEGLSPEQVAFSEKFHPGACKRPANALVALEGASAVVSGCVKSHGVAKPNNDRSVANSPPCLTRATLQPSRPPACRQRVASVTWAPTIRSSRSTTNRNTASCSRPRKHT